MGANEREWTARVSAPPFAEASRQAPLFLQLAEIKESLFYAINLLSPLL